MRQTPPSPEHPEDPDDGDPREGAFASPALEPGLYVVSTPIGNLRDVTLRALDVLRGCDHILAEDTRVSRKLLDAHGISARMSAYHEHNAEQARPRALEALAQGRRVALVSDAGTPLISDPGFKLVEAALAAGARVIPIPGPSALLAALVAAGLPSDRFLFAGFAPAKSAARRRTFDELASVPATLIFYEGASRLPESLADMAAVFGPRPAAVCRELTKRFEEVRRGDLATLAAGITEPPRGEVVVVIGPPGARPAPSDAEIDTALAEAMGRLSLKEAAGEVAQRFGLARKTAYARALGLRGA